MKFIPALLCLLILPVLVFSPILLSGPATAAGLQENVQNNLKGVGDAAGFKTTEDAGLPATVGKIINILLSILGVLFVVLMIYGGILWMTSFGNDQKITKAKDLIISAVIGLVIIVLAYAISNFIVGQLIKTTTT
ncbi:MAG: pilin [Patescibacteria group bacterium]